MKKEEFLAFRDALAPASGFQSVQYRIIELGCAPLINIVSESRREELADASIEDQMEGIYWKNGATREIMANRPTLLPSSWTSIGTTCSSQPKPMNIATYGCGSKS